MTKLFNKKDSSVDLSYSHLVSNEIKWEDFLVDDIEKKLKVVKQAKTDGSNNIPSPNSSDFSNCETKIISNANNYIARIKKVGAKFFEDIKKEINYLLPKLKTNHFSHFASNLNSELEKLLSLTKIKLNNHKKSLNEHLVTLIQFKKNNELSEEAKCPTKEEFLYSFIFIFILFLFELFINAGILGGSLRGGMMAGGLVACGFALINVIFSCLLGYFLFKQRNSIIKFNRIAANIFGAIFITIIIYLNLTLGAYRAAAEMHQKQTDVLNNLSFYELAKKSGKFWNFELNALSMVLVAIGVAASISSIYKGYTFNDVYPGYGSRQKKVNHEREVLKKIIFNLTEEILNLIANQIDNLHNHKKLLIDRLNDWSQNTIKLQNEFNNYEKKLEILEKNVQQLFLLYRNNNKAVRSSPPPDYFGKIKYTLDPKDKDISSIFSVIYDHYYDDKKRIIKYEELLDKVENYFNICLKEIEKVRENFLNKKDKINEEYQNY
jgi:fumarate reductase subunit D